MCYLDLSGSIYNICAHPTLLFARQSIDFWRSGSQHHPRRFPSSSSSSSSLLTLPVLDNVLVHANHDQHLLVDVLPIQVILVNTICSLHPHYPRCMPMNSHKSPLVHVKYEDVLKWDTQIIPVIRPWLSIETPWVWRFPIWIRYPNNWIILN